MTPEQAQKLDAIYNEVTRKDDPSGRGVKMTTHEHLKWMAGKQAEIADAIAKLGEQLAELTADAAQQIAKAPWKPYIALADTAVLTEEGTADA